MRTSTHTLAYNFIQEATANVLKGWGGQRARDQLSALNHSCGDSPRALIQKTTMQTKQVGLPFPDRMSGQVTGSRCCQSEMREKGVVQ